MIPDGLTVLYDSTCALCVRCRDWLIRQDSFVPMHFLPCGSREAREAFGSIPWLGQELVVVSNHGDVWIGPAAFITSLWALREWREWSYRISGPELAPLAERFFHAISSNRRSIAAMISPDDCENGTCRVPHMYR
jgi:predicted DCC family thiol-disulfide oxidoreductase YuxK